MTAACLPPPEHARRPLTALPPGAVDCHAHVFGPFRQFPLADNRPYTPAEIPPERYIRMLDEVGFERGVLVQAVGHGTDCSAMLKALELYPTRLRGIALLRSDVSDAQLQNMSRLGVRGARFTAPPPNLSRGAVGFDVLKTLAPRLARFGWHAQIWASCDRLETLVPELSALGLPLVVDVMGGFDVARGVNDGSFQALLRLLGQGAIWLKLVGYRVSLTPPTYEDIEPFHRALVATNPERLVWGSDWPHVHLQQHMPDVGYLLDLLDTWTGNEAIRRRILVENPAALYAF